MNCIKCGRTVQDGEVFCSVCRMPTVDTVPTPPQPTKKQKRAAAKKKKRESISNGKLLRRLTIALLVAVVLILALLGHLFQERASIAARKDDLRVREASIALREREADSRDAKIAALEQELSESKELIATLQEAFDPHSADTESNNVESTLLWHDNKQLSARVEALESQLESLRNEKMLNDLAVIDLTTRSEFLAKYVVFVQNDGSKRYHRYGCESFSGKDFWAYSPKLAEEAGYVPCPNCN